MRYYRLYFIDSLGHIEDVRECMLADDAAAIAEARRLNHASVIEIWCQGSKIVDVEPGKLRRRFS
ncbi:hypothetical protein [Sphingomonas bacterium]|uniref:hypothetical protein n=1 Tax=Sphingomonas bacterium TaxID=1895847 RepID=UPI0015751C31|nr:hypothetical protein [Sphingomonas bacterium]